MLLNVLNKLKDNVGFRRGSKGLLEPPSGPKLFHFHGGISRDMCEIRQANPPFLHLSPLF